MDTSYLSQQVTTIIERLHGFFDEIGVPTHERDSRESELFSALSETLHSQLNLVAKEKHDLTEEAQRLIKTIRQMERSIDDSHNDDDYESDAKITFPLLDCIQGLKEKHRTVAQLHRERYEQVKKLVEALESYASHLEPSFVQIKLPPTSPNAKLSPTFDLSPRYVTSLDNEFTRVYEEYNKRIATVQQSADDIIGLWSELGTPQAQVDSNIVQFARDSPEQLGLHQEDLKRLASRRDKLVSEKAQRERKLKELKVAVEALWDRLGVEDSERKQFLASNRGCGVRQINEFEDELSRLNELKRQNLHLFVEDARFKLQELWDSLYYSEEEMLDFAPAFSDVYSDALLSAHEQEIVRLEALKEQRAPILAVIDRHRSLIKDREDLEKSSQDASRLMGKGAKGERRDPGKLLREEKQRKRITKELPKVEADLRKTLEAWEDEYGRPFCVHGMRYMDELDAATLKAPPPRSKTPNALPTQRDAPKSAPRSRGQTIHERPPTRSKTPTAGAPRPMSASVMSSSIMSTSLSSHSHSSSTSTLKSTSPSKLPGPGSSRLPMANLRDGPNSPDRKLRNPASQPSLAKEDFGATIRHSASSNAMGPPPPKMKDLFVPPTPTPTGPSHSHMRSTPSFDRPASALSRPPSVTDRPGSVLRHRPASRDEDPYTEPSPNFSQTYRPSNSHARTQSALSASTMAPPPRPAYPRAPMSYDPPSSSRPMSRAEYPAQSYPVAPPSRATSNTSSFSAESAGSLASGSENWETYTDNSDVDEADASEAYYARARAQQQAAGVIRVGGGGGTAKRGMQSPWPKGGLGKKVREEEGSEGGWTDDGEVGEVY